MKERKQSFLERLTGTRVVSNGLPQKGKRRGDDHVLSDEPWSVRVDDVAAEENEENTYMKNTSERAGKEGWGNDDEYSGGEELADSDEAGLALDMYETDNELVIQSMVAGVMPENLHITITRSTVTLSGKRVAPRGIPKGDYLEQELYWGKFSRVITLPFEIDTDGAEAVEKYGLLIIRLPRLDTTKTQELKVRSIQR